MRVSDGVGKHDLGERGMTPVARRLVLLLLLLGGTFLAQGVPARAAFPGQNGRIAFTIDQGADLQHDIYRMNADGGAQTRLTNGGGTVRNLFPAWSPDGTRIAFDSTRDGNSEIYVMNADSSGQTRLTSNAAFDADPSWSPDGKKIAFTSNRSGDDDIWIMNSDGSSPTRLTNSTESDIQSAWSPDGAQIAFATNREGAATDAFDYDIYAMNADGTNQHRVFATTSIDAAPNWAPDGARLVLSTAFDGDNEIFTVSTSPPFNNSSSKRITTNLMDDIFPAWSPDGAKIAFQSSSAGNYDVWSASSSDGSGLTNLTNDPAVSDGRPDWQRQLPPVACFSVSGGALTGQAFDFNASCSSDPAGVIVNYSWDLDGDGSFETNTGTNPTVSRSFPTAGSRTVRLRVFDNDGLSSVSQQSLTVNDRPPRAFLAITPNPAQTKKTVTFDGSASSDSDGTIIDYQWDLDGNGKFERHTGSNPRTTSTYSKSRALKATMRIRDNSGQTSDTVKPFSIQAPRVRAGAQLFIGGAPNGVKVRRLFLTKIPKGAPGRPWMQAREAKGLPAPARESEVADRHLRPPEGKAPKERHGHRDPRDELGVDRPGHSVPDQVRKLQEAARPLPAAWVEQAGQALRLTEPPSRAARPDPPRHCLT